MFLKSLYLRAHFRIYYESGPSKNSLSVDFRANFLFCKETPTTHIRQYEALTPQNGKFAGKTPEWSF